jgi:hypothetical protein
VIHSDLLIAFLRRGALLHSLGPRAMAEFLIESNAKYGRLDKYARQLTPIWQTRAWRRSLPLSRVTANATAGSGVVSVRLPACDREEIADRVLGKRVA